MGTTRKGKPHPSSHGHTRGGKTSPTYQSWATMHTRCRNKNSTHYDRYGGRGIEVCERWGSFHAFLLDMGERPEGTTLDREDNNGPYTKDNCRWADKRTQANNTAVTVRVELHGEVLPLSAWCKRLGVSVNTVRARVKYQGLSYAEALERPTVRPNGKKASGFPAGDIRNTSKRCK